MARKQAKSASKADRSGDVDAGSQPAVISVKMTARFRDWLNGLADSERITTVQLLEKAVVEFAEKRQYPHPAPRRTEGR